MSVGTFAQVVIYLLLFVNLQIYIRSLHVRRYFFSDCDLFVIICELTNNLLGVSMSVGTFAQVVIYLLLFVNLQIYIRSLHVRRYFFSDCDLFVIIYELTNNLLGVSMSVGTFAQVVIYLLLFVNLQIYIRSLHVRRYFFSDCDLFVIICELTNNLLGVSMSVGTFAQVVIYLLLFVNLQIYIRSLHVRRYFFSDCDLFVIIYELTNNLLGVSMSVGTFAQVVIYLLLFVNLQVYFRSFPFFRFN